jgi:hypothetical protein
MMALRSGIRRTWENGFLSTREEAGGRTVSSARRLTEKTTTTTDQPVTKPENYVQN